jgi:hypothetical protein
MSEPISLSSEWFIKPGCEQAALAALSQLALKVQISEPGTLTYLVHTPSRTYPGLQSLPPVDPPVSTFFRGIPGRECLL